MMARYLIRLGVIAALGVTALATPTLVSASAAGLGTLTKVTSTLKLGGNFNCQ